MLLAPLSIAQGDLLPHSDAGIQISERSIEYEPRGRELLFWNSSPVGSVEKWRAQDEGGSWRGRGPRLVFMYRMKRRHLYWCRLSRSSRLSFCLSTH